MGARGNLKLASTPADSVNVASKGTAAADVAPLAPAKPKNVENDSKLSALWDELVPTLDEVGLLGRSDGLAVEIMLRHYLAVVAASEKLLEEGPVEFDEKNQRRMKNPAEVVFRSESETFLKYANALGMTFVARARTPSMQQGGDQGGSPFSDFG